MKKILFGLVLVSLGISASAGRANGFSCASPPPACGVGTNVTYTAATNCSNGKLWFSNFSFTLGGVATGVTVIPVPPTPQGFRFIITPSAVGTSQTASAEIKYTVTTCDQSANTGITDIHAQCNCSETTPATSTVTELYCPGQPSATPCSPGGPATLTLTPATNSLTNVLGTAVSVVGVDKTIVLNASQGGGASNSDTYNTFSNNTVPVELQSFSVD